MPKYRYYQEDTDPGLKLASLFIKLAKAPGSLSRSQWEYLNTVHIGTLMEEADVPRKEAVHVFNVVDRLEADVSRMGRFSHLTDAFMMWMVGASFILAAILLAIIEIPESMLGRLAVPVSLGIGCFFVFKPFLSRRQTISHDKTCFRKIAVEILGTGFSKRSVLTTDSLIREIDPKNPKEVLSEVVDKFMNVQEKKVTQREEVLLLSQLLEGFNLRVEDFLSAEQKKHLLPLAAV